MYHMAVSLSGIKFCPTCILAIYENLLKLKSPNLNTSVKKLHVGKHLIFETYLFHTLF